MGDVLNGEQKSKQVVHSTQSSLLISEIKDGVVVLNDGSLKAVVMATAMNFDLMSSEEQDAVEYSYQGFLNSLHFPVQIIIRSKKMDLEKYLTMLKKQRQLLDNQLLAELMDDYIANIMGLIEDSNIMDKQFFVVVPYSPSVATKITDKSTLLSGITNIFKPTKVVTFGEEDFKKYKQELSQRALLVVNGLNNIGVRAVPLSSQELIDLFYNFYNPGSAENQKMVDTEDLKAPVVTSGSFNQPTTVPQSSQNTNQPQPANIQIPAQQAPAPSVDPRLSTPVTPQPFINQSNNSTGPTSPVNQNPPTGELQP